MGENFDIRTKMVPKNRMQKIARVYFQSMSGGGSHSAKVTENLVNHFIS